MAVTSTLLRPPQTYVEGRYLLDPYLVEGFDAGVQEDVILSLARAATPDPVPAAGVPKLGLAQNEPRVERFSSTKAIVRVSYGDNGGVAISNKWELSESVEEGFQIPVVIAPPVEPDEPASLLRQYSIPTTRGRLRRRFFNVVSTDDQPGITLTGLNNIRRRFEISGVQHVFVGVGFRPWRNSGQLLAVTSFETTGFVPEFAAGALATDSLLVPELGPLEEYGEVDEAATQIEKKTVEQVFPLFGLVGDLYWLL